MLRSAIANEKTVPDDVNVLVVFKMQVNEETLSGLSNYLRQTMSPLPAERRPAEDHIKSVEDKHNFPVLLLTLIDQAAGDMQVRQSAAIYLKNFVERNWKVVSFNELHSIAHCVRTKL